MFGKKKKGLAMYSGLSANEWILQYGELAEQLTPAELPCSPFNSPFLESLLDWNENPQRNVTVTFVLQILLSPCHAIFLKVFFRQPSQAITRFHKKNGSKVFKM